MNRITGTISLLLILVLAACAGGAATQSTQAPAATEALPNTGATESPAAAMTVAPATMAPAITAPAMTEPAAVTAVATEALVTASPETMVTPSPLETSGLPGVAATAGVTAEPLGTSMSPTMTITSDAFQMGGSIPVKYSCNGDNISPPLAWTGVPTDAKSLALIMDDPDASAAGFVHWVVYNLPPDTTGLPEGASSHNQLAVISTVSPMPAGSVQGKNGRNAFSYTGPCPPSGQHHYHFKLYALDTVLNPPDRLDKAGLLQAMQGHILAQTELIGLFQK